MPLDPAQRIQYAGGNVWSMEVEEEYVRFGRSTATHKFWCYWTDRISILQNLAGGAGLNTGNNYIYNNSAYYPYAEFMYFDSMRCVGKVGGGGLKTFGSPQPVTGTPGPTTYQSIFSSTQNLPIVGYDYAECEVKYASLPYVEGQPGEWGIDFSMTELSLSNNTTGSNASSSQTMGLSANVWQWNGGPNNGQVIDNSQYPSLPIPTVQLTFSQYNAAAIPFPTILSLIGLVNTLPLNIASVPASGVAPIFSAPAQTLMFAGGRSQRRLNQLGNPTWDITYNFQYNPFGWNSIINPTDGLFHPIKNNAGYTPFLLDGLGNTGSTAAPFNSGHYIIPNILSTLT
jgi:hypothetical protein